ncbi:hypothetical protein PSPO01_16498 [Paraphaeosphaeria sporulosa]
MAGHDPPSCLEVAVLGRVCPLVDAWHTHDDWTGVNSTAERKKRQNRINQRAYRKRIYSRRRKNAGRALQQSPQREHSVAGVFDASGSSNVERNSDLDQDSARIDGPLLLPCSTHVSYARELLRRAYEDYTLRIPRLTSLAVLIRLSALNAIARNAVLMGSPPESLCRDEFESSYAQAGPQLPPAQLRSTPCPEALMPTTLQRTVRHHPWLDLFPSSAFRDNILRRLVAGGFDDDDLCLDMLYVGPEDLTGKPALIIWGESCDPRAWEANVPFLRKWGFLLHGCPEVIEATNFWRESRGEKKLVWCLA